MPFSFAQSRPFCWWVAVVIDHWSRRSLGLAWFSLRLDGSTEVMLFTVRQKPQNFSGGTFVDAPGNAQSLTVADFTVKALDQWTSPHTQSTYPQDWQITIPAIALDVTVTRSSPTKSSTRPRGAAGQPRLLITRNLLSPSSHASHGHPVVADLAVGGLALLAAALGQQWGSPIAAGPGRRRHQ